MLTGKKADAATKEIFKHIERLKYQDEDWKARDEALERLQTLITEGALSCDGFVNGFASNLKDLVHSLVAQLYDLRSVIVKSAVKTLHLLMIEVGDHRDCERPMREEVLEGLLQLASSGNKVLAAHGREAFPTFIEHVRFESIINVGKWESGVLHWLRGHKHVPVKLVCLSSVLQALQTWPPSLFSEASIESVEVALVEAAANPAGEVRSLARQCLLQHLADRPARSAEVDKYLKAYPDTKKQLNKESSKSGGLPPEARATCVLRQGESGAAVRNGKLGVGGTAGVGSGGRGAAATPRKPSLLKRLSSKSLLGGGAASKGGAKAAAAHQSEASLAAADGVSAAQRMMALKERQGEMSEEEYEAERQKIIQSV